MTAALPIHGSANWDTGLAAYLGVSLNADGTIIGTLSALFNGSDETLTFQAAITAAAGGTLIIPAGKTITTQTVTPLSNTAIVAGGPGAAINIIDDGTSTSQYISILNVSNVTIQGLIIESTNATGRTGVNGLIRLSGATNVFIRHNSFGLSPATALWAKTSTNVEISGNSINGTYADGFHISRGCSYVRIFGNNIQGTGDDCIAINSQLADGAVTYNACEEISIFGNTCGPQTLTTNPGDGIAVYGGTNISITGNVIKGVNAEGILIVAVESGLLGTHYPYGITVSGNTIENPTGSYASTGDGIYVSDARQVTISNNRIDNTERFGIYIYRIAKEIIVSNNAIMRTNSFGVYVQQNTATSIPALLITELFTNLGETGVTTPPMQTIKIANNVIRQTGNSTEGAITVLGESALPAVGVDISHNTVDPNNTALQACIYVQYADFSVVAGNECIATAANTITGITVNTVRRSTVTGNTVVGPATSGTGNGISFASSSQVVIEGNSITSMTNSLFAGETAACLVANNLLFNAQGANIQGTPLATSVYRGNIGYNPVGTVSVTVPATTVAVAAIQYDRDFYVTAGATCAMAIQSGPTVTIPSGGFGLVRVPAGKTVTPTYTSAPTWVVEGL